jgi:glycosyltransferase involved in cell wall biosynthesis
MEKSPSPIPLPPLADSPSVSVVITSYNYEKFIGFAVESVLRQDCPNLEVVVADDGSTDGTAPLIRRYEARDHRVRLISGENLGQPGNTSRGFAATSGQIICFLDADDEFLPGKIDAVVAAFQKSGNCGLCVHPLQRVDIDGHPFGGPFPRSLDSGWLLPDLIRNGGRCAFPPTSGISIRREIAAHVFPIRTRSRRVGDAYIDFPAAFLTEVCTLPISYATYRQHGLNMSWAAVSVAERLAAQLREFEDVFAVNAELVARELGVCLSKQMKLVDSHEFKERALSYLLVTGQESYQGLTAYELVSSLPQGPLRTLWSILLGMPRPLAKALFLLRRRFAERRMK